MVALLSHAVSASLLLTCCSLFGRAMRERISEPINNPDILRRAATRSSIWYRGCGVRGEACAREVAGIVLCLWSACVAPRCSGACFWLFART